MKEIAVHERNEALRHGADALGGVLESAAGTLLQNAGAAIILNNFAIPLPVDAEIAGIILESMVDGLGSVDTPSDKLTKMADYPLRVAA